VSVKINFFNSISSDEVKKYKFDSKIEYYYSSSGRRNILEFQDEGVQVSIDSSNGEWTSKEFGLGVNMLLSLENGEDLYDNKIAYDNSELGLAILWSSPYSKKRGVMEAKKLSNINDRQYFKFDKYFAPNTFHGSIDLEFALILLKKSDRNDIFSINNTQGVHLAEFGRKSIRLDGSGSIFPVVNIHDKSKPLWSIALEYNDPEIDLFHDTVKIELNTAHKDYKYIDVRNKELYCERLVNEIFAHAIAQFLLNLYDEGQMKDIKNKDYDQLSVMQVAKYIIDTKGFDNTSVVTITESILKYFDKKGA
jgi:hypothetical protein